MVSIHNEFALGSTFRACRLVGFVLAVLWLLTPWWGRRDMLLLRCHRRCLWAVLAHRRRSAPSCRRGSRSLRGPAGRCRSGRSRRPRWPTTRRSSSAPRSVLWMCRVITGRHALLAVWPSPDRSSSVRTPAPRSLATVVGLVGRRRQPVPRPRAGASYLGARRARGRADGHGLRLRAHHLAAARADPAGGRPAHRADEGVVGRVRDAAAARCSEIFGSRTVEPVVQRPADRQQLGGDVLGPGLVRRRASRPRFCSCCC